LLIYLDKYFNGHLEMYYFPGTGVRQIEAMPVLLGIW